MDWLSLIWLIVIFGIFYIALPTLARGSKGCVEAFVTTSFVLHFSVLILGAIGLALPGIVLIIFAALLGVETIRHHPWLLQSAYWRDFAIQLLQPSGRTDSLASIKVRIRFPRGIGGEAGLWILLLGAFFYSRSAFAASNLRFLDSGNYSRALSLAVLSSGQSWQVDTTVPLLLPLQILSALPVTAAVRFTGPLVAVLFVLAVAYLAFEYTRNRYASIVAAALVMIMPAWRGGLAGSELGAAELSATFAILGIALARRSRRCAFLAGSLAVGISVTSPFSITVLVGLSCAAAAAAAAKVGSLASFTRVAAAAAIGLLVWFHPAATSDGPYQYESAAQACEQLARTHDRNSWLLVSPGEELPFLYGRGWHLPLASFASGFTLEQIEKPSFRFPYRVRDVFIFVERQPLRAATSGGTVYAATHSTTIRASLQFKVARLLAAYQKTHGDLEILSASAHLIVYRLPGTLAAR